MILLPKQEYLNDEALLTALCVWRESRGETPVAKRGVVWVIRNRCAMAPAEGFKTTMTGNILKPWAFSSFNEDDPNSTKYPELSDPSWQQSQAAVASDLPDPTSGAVFYFSPPLKEPPKVWGPVNNTATLGSLQFYAIAEPDIVT